MSLLSYLKSLFGPRPVAQTSGQLPKPPQGQQPKRGRFDHVIILDGTLCNLRPDHISNVGLAYKLISQPMDGVRRRVYYEEGLQWQGWRHLRDLAEGRGIQGQIRRAYGWLASQYRPGDRIFLLGYSRGAYGVRALAGVIDRMGLLRHDQATARNIRALFRLDESGADAADALRNAAAIDRFRSIHCHATCPIAMIRVFDTVKALGMRLPLLWLLRRPEVEFRDHALGAGVENAFHALALGETRLAFDPVMWRAPSVEHVRMEQVWFRGAHADVGGQLGRADRPRGLSNIPLVWMMGRAEACGLQLPQGWARDYPCDPTSPAVGSWHGWGKLFLLRQRRKICSDPTEELHATALPLPALGGMIDTHSGGGVIPPMPQP